MGESVAKVNRAADVAQEPAADRPAADRVATLHQLLKLTNRLIAPFTTHLAGPHRISLNEFRMLMTIGTLGRTASHELAELTGVNAMSVSRAVATLEKNGRIAVSPDPANRRRKWLSLTAEGERLYRTLRPESERVAAFLFAELTEEEMASFGAMVDRLIATLEATDEAGRSLFLEWTKPAKGALQNDRGIANE
jgi:DNA-binding MarR family transcriptional regulator